MDKKVREASVEALNSLLADFHVTYQNARFCHWNVIGPVFEDNHEVFEDLYEVLYKYIDMFAEQVRQLEEYPVTKYSEYLKTSQFKEYELPMNAGEMQKNMSDDIAKLDEHLTDAINKTEDDAATQDLLIESKRALDKIRWFLRAMTGHK